MYPPTSPNPLPPASTPHPTPYTSTPSPAYSHLPTHQLHHSYPSHPHHSQWTAPLYQSLTRPLDPPPQPSSLQPSVVKNPHLDQFEPPPTHHFHHPVNLIAPHSQPTSLQHSYMYLHPQVVAPVAHVPIGAAHYAHLPPSIWTPPHPQYHHPPSLAHHHHQTPLHAVHQSSSHLQLHALPHTPSTHPHHLSSLHVPPRQHYSLSASHPHLPCHALHPHSVHHHHHHPAYTVPPVPQTTPPRPSKSPRASTHAALPSLAYSADTPRTSAEQAMNDMPEIEEILDGESATLAEQSLKPEKATEDTRPRLSSPNSFAHSSTKRSPSSEPVKLPSANKIHYGCDVGKELEGDRSASQDHEKSASPPQCIQLHSGQSARKPRKPYTITKSREVWTHHEHARFVHALQLYDRDWKKIESFIGTKTVLQIRSHAQKHFGKVTKYQTGEYIPPPRPKKRAVLPYPRSRLSNASKSNAVLVDTGSESGGGSDYTITGVPNACAPVMPNGHSSTTVSGLRVSSQSDDPDSNDASAHSPPTAGGFASHEKRSALTASDCNESAGGIDASKSAHYDSALKTSYEEQGLPGIHTLPTPTAPPEVPSRARLPSWNGVKSLPGSDSREDSRELSHGPSSGDVPNEVDGGPEKVQSKNNNSALINTRDGFGNVHDRVREREVSLQSKDNHETAKVPEQEQGGKHQTEGRNREVLRVTDGGCVPVPNNSLFVLSDCVDIVSDETASRSPAAGWAAAAAARRAHRAKIIRSRKLSLSCAPNVAEINGLATDGNSGKYPSMTEDTTFGLSHERKENRELGMSTAVDGEEMCLSGERAISPPAAVGNVPNVQEPHNPQRNSVGFGINSDDRVAGLSSSDRPSALSSGGSGSGGSLESSDGGDEDPKSSNDGSGDDLLRQQSPPARNGSLADPNSSMSRENSPQDDTSGSGSHSNTQVEKDSSVEKSRSSDGGQNGSKLIGSAKDRAVNWQLDKDSEVQKIKSRSDWQRLCSVASMCSDGVDVEAKMKIENLESRAGGMKRPRSPSSAEVRNGQKFLKGGQDDAREQGRRKCQSIDGIVNRVSIDPRIDDVAKGSCRIPNRSQ